MKMEVILSKCLLIGGADTAGKGSCSRTGLEKGSRGLEEEGTLVRADRVGGTWGSAWRWSWGPEMLQAKRTGTQ